MDYPSDRRLINRAHLSESVPVEIDHHDEHYHGTLKDISELGARMETEDLDGMAQGEEVSCNVRTPIGSSQFQGQIRWCAEDNGHCLAGIRFSRLPSDPHDPLREYIRSVFE